MRRVIIETPYSGDVARNLRFLRLCLLDCLQRGEAPFASHAIYTQPGVLDDANPDERELGIRAGFAYRQVTEATIVYTNLGISRGMQMGIEHSRELDHPVEYRKLEGWDE